MYNYHYLKERAFLYEEAADNFFCQNRLTLNFNIIELFKKLDIDVLPIDSLPADWEYAFNITNNKLKVYYNEPKIFPQKEKFSKKEQSESLEYYQRNLRFILASALADLMAFYQLEEANLIKIEHNGKIYCQGKSKYPLNIHSKEHECEYFAACLLMPKEILEDKFWNLATKKEYQLTFDDIDELGLLFGVNKLAIRQRCKVLNLIKY